MLTITRSPQAGATCHVDLVGELDAFGAQQLRATLSAILRDGHRVVEVDADGVTFTDGSGLGVLVRAWEGVRSVGCEIRLTSPTRDLSRLVGVLGLGACLSGPTA